ncbi:hypothetical protein P2R64_20675 [Priestia megaterium]|uniref:hypothetical protein n=1 Tax=Priestia megaterium TaxID=1404 RepID=UPI0021BF2F24|nr:hypothetical protein [Priestia megaterium]MCT9852869.1 hypothetical protein [Priestia megaterium]MDF1962471.1 hypothetical protein [Priestia megaterium]
MDKYDVFYEMKKYFQQTGQVMDPHVFASQFKGAFSTAEGVEGILMFDQYLNNEVRNRGSVS